jgi:hypothetical protein
LELFDAFLCCLGFSVIFCCPVSSFTIPMLFFSFSLWNIVSPVLPEFSFAESREKMLLTHHLALAHSK